MGNSKLELKFEELREGRCSITDFLSILPEDTERQFEISIVDLISLDNTTINELYKTIQNAELDIKVRYAAFYALCTIYRRNKEYTLYGKILEFYHDEFKNFKSFKYLKGMYHSETADTKDEIIVAIKECRDAIEYARENAGFLHSFSIAVADAFESGLLDLERDKDLIEEAINYVDKAIVLTPRYAKFYSTKGRLKSILGDFQSAKKLIKRAIDMEDSSKEGYSIKLGDYQKHLVTVAYQENMKKMQQEFSKNTNMIKELEAKIKDTYKELEQFKIKNLEMLGFFTALVSFTIGSIQIIGQQSLDHAIRLILVLCGSLLIVLGGFGIILHGRKSIKRNMVVWAMGVTIILIAIFAFGRVSL